MTVEPPPCANIGEEHSCSKPGSLACKDCLLVLYCSPACQKKHWAFHKKWCRSSLMKSSWKPQWAIQDRIPTFVGDGSMEPFGGTKYLWGNMPAIDIVKLQQNEGADYDKNLQLLFAASGDPRNLIKTITSLPTSFTGGIHAVLNDRDLDIVARNAIIFLIAFMIEDSRQATDAIIHLWYSSLIKPQHKALLQDRVLPLIQSVCDKISNKSESTILGKTWNFDRSSFRLVLTKKDWTLLLDYFQVSPDLSTDKSNALRTDIMLAPGRVDRRDRHYMTMKPSHRVAEECYRTHGLLLPFGASRAEFIVPNPTLYQQSHVWPLKDSSDPLNGWSSQDISSTYPWPSSADRYGMMHHFLAKLLRRFHKRLRACVALEVFNLPAHELGRHLKEGSFARIEVSNISDRGYLGCQGVLVALSSLLQPHSVNPHATLIMLFMNAIDETQTQEDMKKDMISTFATRMKYLKMPMQLPNSQYDPKFLLLNFIGNMFCDKERYFNRYMRNCKMQEVGHSLDMEMKSRHTIVDKWPLALKLKYGEPGAQEEFDSALASGTQGTERYMEWKPME